MTATVGSGRRLGIGVLGGGALTILGWAMSRDVVVDPMKVEDKVVLALGIFVALAGLGLMFEMPRGKRMLSVAALVAAPPIVGLEINVRLVAAFHEGLGPSLMLIGAVIATAAAGTFVARELIARPAAGDVVTKGALIAAGSMVTVTAFLEWGPGVTGMDLPPGKYIVGFGIAIAVLAAVSLLAHESKMGAIALVGASGVAAATAALAIDIGFVLEPSAISTALYVLIAASFMAAAVAATAIALRFGFPEPSFPAWVPMTFAGLGIFGLVLSTTLAEEFEDAGGSLFGLRLGTTMLLLTGVGMLAGQAWAWFLGFPVALMGIANAVLVLVFAEVKSFGWLALLLYVNALRALWTARGFTWTDGETPHEEALPAVGSSPAPVIAPISAPTPEPAAITPPPVPEPVAITPPPVAEVSPPAPTAEPQPSTVAPQPAVIATRAPRRGLPLSVQYVLGGVALVAIAVTAYTLGRGSDETPAPGAAAVASTVPETVPDATMPTAEPTPAPIPGDVLVLNASSDFKVRGCAITLKWNWILDPATAPPSGSEAFVELSGPQMPGVAVVDSDGTTVTMRQEAGLLNGGGTWTATLFSVGGLPVYHWPIEVSYFPAC